MAAHRARSSPAIGTLVGAGHRRTGNRFPSAVDVERRRPLKILLAERSDGASLSSLPLHNNGDVWLLIGPEGGWEEEEFRQLREQGVVRVTLGPRILRAETAAIAAITVLQSRLGELG